MVRLPHERYRRRPGRPHDSTVGFIRDFIAGRQLFSTSVDAGVLYGTPTVDDYVAGRLGKVNRSQAITVPAVKRARDLVAGSIGTLPMTMAKAGEAAVDWPLLEAPETGTAGAVTWTRVAEDLLFHGAAWLRVTHVGWHGKPVTVKRLDPASVTVDPEHRTWYSRTGSGTALEYLPDDQLIRIDSPNDPLLVAGRTAILTCLALGNSTRNVAGGLPPSSYFTPKDGIDVFDKAEVQELLDNWHAARERNVTGYVPGALDLKALGWNPEQLQLKDLRDQAVIEIARLSGIDAEELNVSTTSRTYFNAWDRKQDFIQFTLGPYLAAIEGRLSMDDVTPHGYKVRYDLDGFFQADTLARYQAYQVGLDVGAITRPEIREAEKRPVLPDTPTPTPKETADA